MIRRGSYGIELLSQFKMFFSLCRSIVFGMYHYCWLSCCLNTDTMEAAKEKRNAFRHWKRRQKRRNHQPFKRRQYEEKRNYYWKGNEQTICTNSVCIQIRLVTKSGAPNALIRFENGFESCYGAHTTIPILSLFQFVYYMNTDNCNFPYKWINQIGAFTNTFPI